MITSQVNGTGKKSAQILKKQLDRKEKKQCGDFNVEKDRKENSGPEITAKTKQRREQRATW